MDVHDYFKSGVRVNDNDSIEAAIKKFKREVTNAGTLTELKRREFYEKPSMLKKKARDAAIRKRERKRMLYGNDWVLINYYLTFR